MMVDPLVWSLEWSAGLFLILSSATLLVGAMMFCIRRGWSRLPCFRGVTCIFLSCIISCRS
jgi:hypothetical protein